MFQILMSIFGPIKSKVKSYGISYHNHVFSMIIMTWLNCCKSDKYFIFCISIIKLLRWYKKIKYLSNFIFLHLYESFPDFICANNIVSLVNNLFWFRTFNPVPVIFLFQKFNVFLSATIFSSSAFTSLSHSSGCKSSLCLSKYKSIGKLQTYFELLWFYSKGL